MYDTQLKALHSKVKDYLRMSGVIGVTVLYHMRLVRADSCV